MIIKDIDKHRTDADNVDAVQSLRVACYALGYGSRRHHGWQ
jgi:hypothetical protein